MLFRIVSLVIALSFSSLAFAESVVGYWDIEIPVMNGATNIAGEKDSRFSSIHKSYDLIMTDPVLVSRFYDKFFESIGWINWSKPITEIVKDQNDSTSFICGWSSYHFDLTSNGAPEAIFQLTWNAEKIPAFASLRLEINNYSNGQYSGKVKISIVPKIDFLKHSSKLTELFNDPKNFFILSRAVKGNPMKVDEINIGHLSHIKNSDPIIERYYNIVTAIMNDYKKFHDKYNR